VSWTRVAHQRTLWLILGAILVVAGSATATGVVLNQEFSPTNATNLMINDCAGYSLVDETVLVPGTTTNLTYDCGQGVPAFEVGPFPTGVRYFEAVPTFTLPVGLSALFVVIPGSAGSGSGILPCQAYYGTAYELTSGLPIDFQGGGPALSWDYCADLSLGIVLTVPFFSITWSYA
jgi:hypothetical protein